MTRKKDNRGFSLVELVVAIAIMAVMAGVLFPTLFHYIERSREGKDNHTMGELLEQLYLSAAADYEAYVTVPDDGQPFSKAADSDTMIVCPSDADGTLTGTLYQKSVATYLGHSELTFYSDKWKAAELEVRVNLTWDGIRLEYNDALKELMGAENLRYE